jgi:hypothetical protein
MKLAINRFPIFCLWCFVVARHDGFDEDEAKSLAVTRAKLGAAAKSGALSGGFGGKYGAANYSRTPNDRAIQSGELEGIAFVGMQPLAKRLSNGELRGVLRSNGVPKIIQPEEFDLAMRKFGSAFHQVMEAMEYLASKYDDVLAGRAYKLYEEFRPIVHGFGGRGEFDTNKLIDMGNKR